MSLFSHIFSIFWWIHCAPCYIQSCESTLLLINWCLSTIRLLWCWVIVRIVLLAEHTWLIHCNCLFNCWQVFTQEDWMLWLNQSVLQQSISLGVYTPMQPAYCTFSLPLYFLIHFCPNRPIFFFNLNLHLYTTITMGRVLKLFTVVLFLIITKTQVFL